jgi:hypothetical protein
MNIDGLENNMKILYFEFSGTWCAYIPIMNQIADYFHMLVNYSNIQKKEC